MKALLPLLIERLKQPSTYKGLATVLSLVAGIVVPDGIIQAASAIIIASIGLVEVARDEYK